MEKFLHLISVQWQVCESTIFFKKIFRLSFCTRTSRLGTVVDQNPTGAVSVLSSEFLKTQFAQCTIGSFEPETHKDEFQVFVLLSSILRLVRAKRK